MKHSVQGKPSLSAIKFCQIIKVDKRGFFFLSFFFSFIIRSPERWGNHLHHWVTLSKTLIEWLPEKPVIKLAVVYKTHHKHQGRSKLKQRTNQEMLNDISSRRSPGLSYSEDHIRCYFKQVTWIASINYFVQVVTLVLVLEYREIQSKSWWNFRD